MKKMLLLIMFFTFTLVYSLTNAAVGKVAYLAFTNGYWQVWIMNSNGSDKQQVTRSEYDKSRISWYPDGTHILINGHEGEIEKVNITDGKGSTINLPLTGMSDASVSPITGKIVFSLSVAGSRDNNHIWATDKYGNNLDKLTNMPSLQHQPVWSFDEKWIYFLSGEGKEAHDIMRVSVGTKNVEQVTAGHLYNFDVSISRYGDLAFSSNRSGDYEIWVRTSAGDKQITHHTGLDARPSWSADAKQIFFESADNGTMNIWSVTLEDMQLTQLTTDTDYGARHPVTWWPVLDERLSNK